MSEYFQARYNFPKRRLDRILPDKFIDHRQLQLMHLRGNRLKPWVIKITWLTSRFLYCRKFEDKAETSNKGRLRNSRKGPNKGLHLLFQSPKIEFPFPHTVLISFNPIKVMLNLEQNLGGERPTSALKLTRAKTAPEIEVKQNKISQKVTEEYEISQTKSAPKIPSGNDRTKFLNKNCSFSFDVQSSNHSSSLLHVQRRYCHSGS